MFRGFPNSWALFSIDGSAPKPLLMPRARSHTLSLRVRDVQFADIRQFVAFQSLAAAGFSAGGGLGMGISPLADCLAKVGER